MKLNHEDNHDNAQFIARLKNGDQSAYDDLFHTHYLKLFHFAYAIVNDKSTAQDIIQEIFTTLWSNRKELDTTQNVISYLYVSIRNRCYSFITRRHPSTPIEEINDSIQTPDLSPDENIKSPIIWNAIESLPLQQKIIFKLIVIEEYTYKEAAEKLDITINTIKTQMQRACKHLRKVLPPSHFFLLFTPHKIN